jgi:hypothetical protein
MAGAGVSPRRPNAADRLLTVTDASPKVEPLNRAAPAPCPLECREIAMSVRVLTAALALAGSMMTVAPSIAAPIEFLIDHALEAHATVPECDDPAVLGFIVNQHRTADLNAGMPSITEIEKARETRFVVDKPSPIARRYCQAHAILDDGNHPQVFYLIERRAGFASWSWNVEFCLAGRDRWHVHGGRCRTVREF